MTVVFSNLAVSPDLAGGRVTGWSVIMTGRFSEGHLRRQGVAGRAETPHRHHYQHHDSPVSASPEPSGVQQTLGPAANTLGGATINTVFGGLV